MNILVVTNMFPTAERPGTGTFVRAQVEQIRRLGHKVDVLSLGQRHGKLRYLLGNSEVLRATRSVPYDVVHAHYGLTAMSCMARSGSPLVITFHGSDVLVGVVEPLISRVVRRFAAEVIAVSPSIAKRVGGVVIPCGVDLDLFRPIAKLEARARLKLDLQRRYILFPYAASRTVKRFDLACEAVNRLRTDGCDVELLTIANEAIDRMPLYYSAVDAMVLVSDSEGSPTALKEALACNLPVVARNVGDVAEITGKLTSVAFCAADAASISNCLKAVLSRGVGEWPPSRPEMQRYSAELIARRVEAVYERVSRKSAASRGARLGRAQYSGDAGESAQSGEALK